MRLKEKGVSMVEVLVTVAILGLLAALVVPSYQETVRRSREKQAMAHLAGYYRGAKLIIAEFSYNPGNFHAVGFKAEGDIYHRIEARDNGLRLPEMYPDDCRCASTKPTLETPCNDPAHLVHNQPHSASHSWTEVETNFLPGPRPPVITDKEFNVYALPSMGRNANEIMCIDESGDITMGDCP